MIKSILFAGLVALTAPALYAQGSSVAFGAIQQDTSAPIEASADNLAVDQTTGIATLTGNVVIGQGEMRLTAAKVEIVYLSTQSGISRLEATGDVTLVSGPDAAEAQNADYDVERGTIVMTGDVLVTQGQSALTADRMTVNLDDGTAQMTGRVKTILQTGQN